MPVAAQIFRQVSSVLWYGERGYVNSIQIAMIHPYNVNLLFNRLSPSIRLNYHN